MTGGQAVNGRQATGRGAISAIPRQARPYQGLRAGIVTRFLAAAVDVGVVAGILIAGYAAWAVTLFVLPPSDFHFPQLSALGVLIAFDAVLVVYLAVAWRVIGRSYGQQVMGLRVIDRLGGRLNLVTAFLRGLLCALFAMGLFWVVFSRSNRSVQDLILHTSVIYDWRPNEK